MLKNKTKKFRDIFPRQIFEIYLEEINKYAYGVVIQGFKIKYIPLL